MSYQPQLWGTQTITPVYSQGLGKMTDFEGSKSPWVSDRDCEANEAINDPVSLGPIGIGRGFRLAAEQVVDADGKQRGQCYDAETIRRISNNKGPTTNIEFTKVDKQRKRDYISKNPNEITDYM